MKNIAEYFATARERYYIKFLRDAGEPKPWTDDPIFLDWRFCNVHREDDKTTVWFRENIRLPIMAKMYELEPEVGRLRMVEGTMFFRWFNRIETGEIIKDLLVEGWDTEEARRRLKDVSPVCTGSYIINSGFDGKSKLDGILDHIDRARKLLPPMIPSPGRVSLQWMWDKLRTIPFHGRFMSYEVVSDLRHTPILWEADDVMTWANAGPGAARGLSRVWDGSTNYFKSDNQGHQVGMCQMMQDIVGLSQDERFWPQEWKVWEMREAEHWACEYDKYCRIKEGGQMKMKFKGRV